MVVEAPCSIIAPPVTETATPGTVTVPIVGISKRAVPTALPEHLRHFKAEGVVIEVVSECGAYVAALRFPVVANHSPHVAQVAG